MHPRPNERVIQWIHRQPTALLCTTSITRGEVLRGIYLLPLGRKRGALLAAALAVFDQALASRIAAFDSHAADLYAAVVASRHAHGLPITEADAMIAAIARLHGARLATRNVADFDQCGIEVVNPWQ